MILPLSLLPYSLIQVPFSHFFEQERSSLSVSLFLKFVLWPFGSSVAKTSLWNGRNAQYARLGVPSWLPRRSMHAAFVDA
jgi:hypothetical protein